MEGSVLRGLSGKILKTNLLSVVLFGAIWLAVTLYFKIENDRANTNQRMRDPRKNDKDYEQGWYRQGKPVGCRFPV